MPFLAQKPASKIALKPEDVGTKFGPNDKLSCPYCEDVVTYRSEGIKKDTGKRHYRAHFWHSEKAGGSSQTGGCEYAGESAEHEEMKMALGDMLRRKYDVPNYSVEKMIGSKKADVAINLNGRLNGVAVEYQHKNESKDYIETTEEYLGQGYGVYWVFNTEEDYDMLFTAKDEFTAHYGTAPYFGEKNKTNNPPIRLGGLVDPWPYVVPESQDWGSGYTDERQQTSQSLLGQLVLAEKFNRRMDIVDVPAEVPATLPPEFFDWLAQVIKRDYGWENMFSPPEDYTDIWCYSKVPATLPPEWHQEKAREYWSNEPWIERFWLSYRERFYPLVDVEPHVEMETVIPIAKWILDQPDSGYYKEYLKHFYFEGQRMSTDTPVIRVKCNECGEQTTSEVVGGIGGMIQYSTRTHCQNCNQQQWHTEQFA